MATVSTSQRPFSTAHFNRATGSDEGRGLSGALGWLSVGLGLSELLAPAPLARLVGVAAEGLAPSVLRAFGLRELAVGVAALSRPRRAAPLWARVAGDALDIATLVYAATLRTSSRRRAAAALVGLAGITAIDIVAARRLSKNKVAAPATVYGVTISRPPEEVYAFFRRLENLPLFMDYLQSVTVIDETRSRWAARFPVGGPVTWEATITDDVPGHLLSWHAEGSASLEHRGTVTFHHAPGRDSTEVRVAMALGIAGVKPNPKLAKLLTRAQIKGDLRRLKAVMETGEVLFSDASAVRRRQPAQPSPDGIRHANERARQSRSAAEEGGLL
jgi:uncharacterized membrane protein